MISTSKNKKTPSVFHPRILRIMVCANRCFSFNIYAAFFPFQATLLYALVQRYTRGDPNIETTDYHPKNKLFSKAKLDKYNCYPFVFNTYTRTQPKTGPVAISNLRPIYNPRFFIRVAIFAVNVDVIAVSFNLGSVVVGYVYKDLHELLVTSQSNNNGADKKR